jgi:hypothetical protein
LDNSKNREGWRGTTKRSGAARERRMGWWMDRGELESYAHTTVTLDIRK